MSAAFVPGRILRDTPWSTLLNPPSLPFSSDIAAVGDKGPI